MVKLLLIVLGVGCALWARAADHGDSPQVRVDTRLDINDVYIFQSPADASHTVMIMTVCPVAGIVAPKEFAPKAKYEFAIDTSNDYREDQVYTLVFAKPGADGHQSFLLKGPNKTKVRGTSASEVALPNGGKLTADIFDDPFFFDLIAFRRGLAFSPQVAHNFFDGLSTMAIVIEVPSSSFGSIAGGSLHLWGRTRKGRVQVDRMGRPAINTVLITASGKDQFNATSPADDRARFRPLVVAAITEALKRDEATANALADALLPDVLAFDPTSTAGFLNGRRLEDDVIDIELKLLTGNDAASDFVANDSAFRATFPYLAPSK